MRAELEVSGLDTVIKQITSASTGISNAISNILPRIGKMVTRSSKQYAPYKTGALEESIKYKTGRDYVAIGVYDSENPEVAKYAGYIHYGIYKLGPGSVAKGGNVGRLYIKRAIEDNRDNITNQINKILRTI